MNITKCPSGHFYDADKYQACPHCGTAGGVSIGNDHKRSEYAKTKNNSDTDIGSVKTESLVIFKENNKPEASVKPVVGWLVCIKGQHYGESIDMYAGSNFISAKKDLVLFYEPNARVFFVQPVNNGSISYLNDVIITETKIIKAKDRIVSDGSTYVFVPFCGSDFSWDTIAGA